MLLRLTTLTLLLTACGDDGTVVDAGVDLGVDGGQDLGRDAGFRDHGPPDLGRPDMPPDLGPDDPEWVAVWDDHPQGCALERAIHPERVLRPVWASCGDSCEYLAPDPRVDREPPGLVGWSDGETGYFSIRQIRRGGSTADSPYTTTVATTSAGLLALRTQPPDGAERCAWGSFAGHGNDFATTAMIRRSDTDYEFRAVRMTLGGSSVHFPSVPSEQTPSSVIQAGALGSQLYATEVQPLAQIFAFAEGTMTPMGGALGDVRGIPQNEMAIGDTALWETWGGADIGIAYGRMDLPGASYLAIEGVRLIGTDVDEDTNTIAWQQAYNHLGDGQYERLELWTAEFERDPADLEPRLVRELDPFQSAGTLDGGYYARFTTVPDRGVELLELATGDRRYVPTPEGLAFGGGALWITSTEIAIPAGILDPRQATVVRVQLDSLPVEDG